LSNFELDPFFLLSKPKSDRCVADLDSENPYQSDKIICRIFPDHRRARRVSPLNMIVPCNSPPDIIFTWMSECLIQERARKIFEDEGLTGFSTRPATAKVQATRALLDVSELIVTGWGGIAPASSGIREVERCEGCGFLRYSGIEEPSKLIDTGNWDGSDFFMIWPLPRYRFVTQRVVEVCKRHGVSGVDFSRNFPAPSGKVISGYSPGRLSYCMPADRAHQLGDPHGIF
jgi:hypothetical protein